MLSDPQALRAVKGWLLSSSQGFAIVEPYTPQTQRSDFLLVRNLTSNWKWPWFSGKTLGKIVQLKVDRTLITVLPLFKCACMCVLVTQSCLTLSNPVDWSPPGSSVHGILQARILEWVAISFSRGSSWPRDQTWDSSTAGRFFTVWVTREVYCCLIQHIKILAISLFSSQNLSSLRFPSQKLS